jgi:hypothetical protein
VTGGGGFRSKELAEALFEMEKAEKEYRKIAIKYIYTGPAGSAGRKPTPQTIDAEGRRKLADAWNKRQAAEDRFSELFAEYNRKKGTGEN